jgi:hypothetical protein
MSAGSMPSLSATICDQAVSWPWPWGVDPVTTCTVPVGSTRTVAASQPPAPKLSEASTRLGARPHIST